MPNSTLNTFLGTLQEMGSDVTFHREDGGTECPCLTPEGFRDPAWHRAHPSEPVCNEQGMLATNVIDLVIKAVVQPALRGYSRAAQRSNDLLGDVQRDDKFGVFPCEWNGQVLDFDDWSEAGEDYITYDTKRYMVVAADKLADIDGNPSHHWEVGLRLLSASRPS